MIIILCEILWSIEMRFCMERTNLLNCHEMLSCSIVHHCFGLRPKLFWCLFPKMHRMCVNVWLSFNKEFVLLSLKQFLMPLAWHCSFCVKFCDQLRWDFACKEPICWIVMKSYPAVIWLVHHCFRLRPKLFWRLSPKMNRMCVNVCAAFS